MKIRNNSPRFGDCGPFDAESFEDLADEMEGAFDQWAREEWQDLVCSVSKDESVPMLRDYLIVAVDRLRAEFIEGLTTEKENEDD